TGSPLRSDGTSPEAEVGRVYEETIALLSRLGHGAATGPRDYMSAQLSDDFLALWSIGAGMRLQSASEMAGLADDADLSQSFEPLMLGMARRAGGYDEATRNAIVGRLEAFSAAYRAAFDDVDIVVTPTLGSPAAPIGYLGASVPFEEHIERVTEYAGYTGAENVAGLPSINLPMGWSADGLPIGMQFVGAPGTEPMLLGLAYELEREFRWADRKPPIWVGDAELPS
ncbi:MAG: amidase family protein, partial [Pacificimonas sp.]